MFHFYKQPEYNELVSERKKHKQYFRSILIRCLKVFNTGIFTLSYGKFLPFAVFPLLFPRYNISEIQDIYRELICSLIFILYLVATC